MIGLAAFIEATEGVTTNLAMVLLTAKMNFQTSTITALPQHIPNDMVVGYLIVFERCGHLVKAPTLETNELQMD